MNDEKSLVLSGWRASPTTLPPPSLMILVMSAAI
jgi:hypothetical protein